MLYGMGIKSIGIIIFIFVSVIITLTHGTGDLRLCIQTLRKITVQTSCMKCNPALQYCQGNCQNLVDATYRNCDNICLPDGYYYDARKYRYFYAHFYVCVKIFYMPICLYYLLIFTIYIPCLYLSYLVFPYISMFLHYNSVICICREHSIRLFPWQRRRLQTICWILWL
jgi:hypothetical protein